MKLIQTVEVRQIVTERSKQELAAAFLARKHQLERECDQLRFEQKRMEKSGNYPPALVKQYFAKEIDERIETHISQPLHNIQPGYAHKNNFLYKNCKIINFYSVKPGLFRIFIQGAKCE